MQAARRPFTQRARNVLHIDGLAGFPGLPSERRMEAEVDTRGYYTYPLLFYSAFADVSLAQLRTLSLCGSYLFDYILTLDEQLDNPAGAGAGSMVLGSLLQHEALMLLSSLFPAGGPYWSHFTAYVEQFIQAALRERLRHHGLCTPYTDAELERIYAGKAAIGKACIAALAHLSGRCELIAPMGASHDDFHVGYQLFDDLQDWRVDYERRQYSYPLTWAFRQAGWMSRVEASDPPHPDVVGRMLVETGAVEHTRALAMTYFDRALDRLDLDMSDGSWAAAIRQARRLVASLDIEIETAARRPVASDRTERLDWASVIDADATATPVAAGWTGWLDPARVPYVDDARIRAAQHRALLRAGGASTVGEAVCQVGAAIAASRASYPLHPLSEHLGLRAGELAWCARNAQWLDALLAGSLDEPARHWTTDAASASAVGWVPTGIGRVVGLRLVDAYIQAVPGADATPVDVLHHFRIQTVT